MGKSGKKSKSEKINALRKQYDAFLEEDKKRKDRNEYILGRMETMRSCTALVHVSSKPHPKIEESVYPSRPKYKGTMAHISNSAMALSGDPPIHVTPKYANTIYDEPSLLREISKKYFLIPKVKSNDVYNVNYKEDDRDPIPPSDTDWKNKYNILEELKRAEKEDHSTIIPEKENKQLDDSLKNYSNTDYIPIESNDTLIAQNNTTLSLELTPRKPQTDMCEKPNKEVSFTDLDIKRNENKEEQVDTTWKRDDIGVINLNMEKQDLVSQSNKSHEVNLPAHSLLPQNPRLEKNKTQDTTLNSGNNKIHDFKESNKLHDEKLTSKKELFTAAPENKKYLPEEKNCIEINESQDNANNVNHVNDDLSPIVKCDNNMDLNNENTMEMSNENNAFSVKNIENINEFVDDNMVRAQVYEEVVNHSKDNTGHQEYEHQESDLNKIQNITSEVNDELETEQKEMFYGEDNDQIKEYNENDDTTTYQAENENYINQEYSYYDESQKEHAYPTEINEHEESTERYDPNYEQQYVNNYDGTINTTQYQPEQYNVDDQHQNMYDQQQGDINYQPENPNYEYAPTDSVKDAEPSQNVYYTNGLQENSQYEGQQLENSEMVDQPNIAYTSSEDYDAQQEYITMNVEPLPIENVEQQLDVEDGYLPNSNIEAENVLYQEQVIEEATPEIQQTDIKVT